MTIVEEIAICKEAIQKYGFAKQSRMVMEETGEMLSALAKYPRNRASIMDVITELADVVIMMEQMAVFFGYDDFIKEKERKLRRLKQNLDAPIKE